MKEEMQELRSRVEALEQVSCSTSLCPALLSQLPPGAVCSQGFPPPRLYF